MKYIGIIPARYASTRFPGKPLELLGVKPMIQRVYEQVAGILDEAYVATDDERIEATVKSFGGKVVMTSTHHRSGTDRCYEAYTKVGQGYDVVVNIQGDEPFISPKLIDSVIEAHRATNSDLVTAASKIGDANMLINPNVVKVLRDGQAFSRRPRPIRGCRYA